MAYVVPTKASVYFPAFFEALPSASGKLAVITGTTSGVGLVAALTCARKGAHVVLLNRDSESAAKHFKTLQEQVPEATIEWVKCDLMQFSSVKAATAELLLKFGDRENGIDILCNNAGVMAFDDQATVDGYDVQIQVNHLSHFLLTKELFPLLLKSPDGRIVTQTSGARWKLPVPLKGKYLDKNGGHLGGNGSNMAFGGRWHRYHQSKLANAVFSLELARKLTSAGITNVKSICVAPGLCATGLQETTTKRGGLSHSGATSLMKNSQSPEDGAMNMLRGMLDESVSNGDTYEPGGRGAQTGPSTKRFPGFLSTSRRAAKVLWTKSEAACGEFRPQKSKL